MAATGLTELEYGEMVLNYANLWMQKYFGPDEQIQGAFHHSKWFWKWWVGQWQNRDADFIDKHQESLQELPFDVTSREVTKWLYEDFHNIDGYVIIPNIRVVKEVGKLIQIEKNKIKILKQQ